MNTLQKILLIFGIVGLIICIGLYFIKTETIEVQDSPVKIVKATKYIDSGLISKDFHTEIQVEPTKTTKPGMTYLLVLDNGTNKQEYEVSWEQLEIDIHKVQTISKKISQDEYTAWEMNPNFTTKTFEIKPQRQMLYLPLGILFFVAGILSYIYIGRKIEENEALYDLDFGPYRGTTLTTPPEAMNYVRTEPISWAKEDVIVPPKEVTSENIAEHTTNKITDIITKALEAMDRTDKWYWDENAANRELVSCLKSQGIEANYRFNLPDGGTADAIIGNEVLIEGKLEPDMNEVNRLIGQLQWYSKYPYKVHVVIYGRVKENFLRRINDEINNRYANKVFLNYLPHPNRVRRQG